MATGRFGELDVGVSWVGEHTLADEVGVVGWVGLSGGERSWRKRFISSWVDSLGLSCRGVLVGDGGSRRWSDRERDCLRGVVASVV